MAPASPTSTRSLPAINLLLLISVLSAVLLVINIWQRGWVLPVTAVGLWVVVAIVMGAIYPAIIQRFRAEPEESQKEAIYIERNIEATRQALGLDNVITRPFSPDTQITVEELAGNESVRNIRLLDPDIVPNAFQVEQSERTFYTFGSEVDVDRYEIDGEDHRGGYRCPPAKRGRRPPAVLGGAPRSIHPRLWRGSGAGKFCYHSGVARLRCGRRAGGGQRRL